jgi:hypothetical protein
MAASSLVSSTGVLLGLGAGFLACGDGKITESDNGGSESESESEAESESESEGECGTIVECALGGACTATDTKTKCPICFWTCDTDEDCPRADDLGCYRCDEAPTDGGTVRVCRPVDDPDPECETGEPGMLCMGAGACKDGGPCYTYEDPDEEWTNGYCTSPCEPEED